MKVGEWFHQLAYDHQLCQQIFLTMMLPSLLSHDMIEGLVVHAQFARYQNLKVYI